MKVGDYVKIKTGRVISTQGLITDITLGTLGETWITVNNEEWVYEEDLDEIIDSELIETKIGSLMYE